MAESGWHLSNHVEGECFGSGQGSGGIGNVLEKLNKNCLKWVSNRNVWAFNMFQHKSKAILIHPVEPTFEATQMWAVIKNILPVKLHCTLGWGGGWLGDPWAILKGKWLIFVWTRAKKTRSGPFRGNHVTRRMFFKLRGLASAAPRGRRSCSDSTASWFDNSVYRLFAWAPHTFPKKCLRKGFLLVHSRSGHQTYLNILRNVKKTCLFKFYDKCQPDSAIYIYIYI